MDGITGLFHSFMKREGHFKRREAHSRFIVLALFREKTERVTERGDHSSQDAVAGIRPSLCVWRVGEFDSFVLRLNGEWA